MPAHLTVISYLGNDYFYRSADGSHNVSSSNAEHSIVSLIMNRAYFILI
jgi:hypothetical protein